MGKHWVYGIGSCFLAFAVIGWSIHQARSVQTRLSRHTESQLEEAAYVVVGFRRLRQQRYEEAQAAFQTAILINPNSVWGSCGLILVEKTLEAPAEERKTLYQPYYDWETRHMLDFARSYDGNPNHLNNLIHAEMYLAIGVATEPKYYTEAIAIRGRALAGLRAKSIELNIGALDRYVQHIEER